MPEEVEQFLDGLSQETKEELRVGLNGEALEELAERVDGFAAKGQVTVFLSGMGKAWEAESVTVNGTALQINVDDTVEPIAKCIDD